MISSLPDTLGISYYDSFNDLTLAGEWIYTLAGIAAITLVMPFHTMAGFALYLNRRIELEAWDIEISFRNLANRKQRATSHRAGVVSAIVLAGLVTLTMPAAVDAAIEHDHESALQLIESVLQGQDFGEERKVRKWRFKGWSEADEEAIPEWMIDFLEWLELFKDWAEVLSNIAAWVKVLLVLAFAGLVALPV